METNFFKFYKYPAWILIASLALIISSCSKDDEPSNQAPGQTSLVTPSNQEKDVDISEVELSWKASTDPDGDTVSYDIYLDTINPPVEKVMENAAQTSVKLSGDLEFERTYFWSVTAKDGSGAETSSDVGTFSTRALTTAELIVGKWILTLIEQNSTTSAVTCQGKSYFEFAANGHLIIVYNTGSECDIFDRRDLTYSVTNQNTIAVHSPGSEDIIIIVDSKTQTNLALELEPGVIYHFEREG